MSEMNFVARQALLALAAAAAAPVWAANECKVEYGYFTGSGMNRQDQTQTVDMNAGQTLSVKRSNLNFVRNTGNNKVDVTLSGAANNNFTLDKNQRNPNVLFYATPTTLVSLLCTQGATVSAPSTPQQMVNQMKQANASVNQIAQQLKTTFNQTGQQVAELLKAAGYGATQVAAALASAFNATGAQVATWLKAAGYTGEEVAAALKAQFDATASQAAGWLKSAFNATGAQVAAWLKVAAYTGEQVAAALKAQFNATASQAAGWLKDTFNATGAQIAAWLKAAGYTGEQVAAALKAQFNATASQAAGWLKDTFNATGAQVAAWLKAAGYTGEQVAAALKAQFNATASQAAGWLQSAFNATSQQLAQWLRDAGYTLTQVAQALDQLKLDPAPAMAAVRQAFNVTWTEVVNAYKTIADALRPTNCGAAGCITGAQLLQAAGAAAAEAIKALKDAYGLTESAAQQIARNVFGLTGQAIDAALAAAGYATRQVAGTVRDAVDTTVRTVQNPSSAGVFIDCVTWPDRICTQPDSRRPPLLGILVKYETSTLQFKVLGKNLMGINGISGLPARNVNLSSGPGQINATVELNQRGANWTGPTSGTAQLTANGQPVPGGTFAWSFTIDRTAPVAAPRLGAPSASPLRTSIDQTTLYKVGSGTTTDANGDNYTLLEKNASHCQTVAAPNPPYNANGSQNATRATITVANISWTVTNSGTSAASFTAEVVRGSQVLATHSNLNLAAGQTLNFTTQRPQNNTCVAKVGGGGECYHCGLPHEGWRDNDVFVRIK